MSLLRHKWVLDDVLQSLSHLQLADDYGYDHNLNLDMLVDVDNYFKFVSADSVVRLKDLVADESMFCWILSGTCLRTSEEIVCHQMLCVCTACYVNEADLYNFWKLKSVNICTETDRPTKGPLFNNFKKTVQYVDGMRLLCLGKMKMES